MGLSRILSRRHATVYVSNATPPGHDLRVPLLTVQRQAKAGRLPGRLIEKKWRFSRPVLLEWMAAGLDRHDLALYNCRTDANESEAEAKVQRSFRVPTSSS